MRWILGISGLLLILDSVFAEYVSTTNFGTILPAILGLPLLIIAIFYAPLKEWFVSFSGKIFMWVLISSYSIFIIGFCVSLFFIYGNLKDPSPNADAIIVLGAGLRGDRVSSLLAMRLIEGERYLDKNPNAVIVVSGGQGADEVCAESEAMERYLLSRGVDESKILKESRSQSTIENFKFSKEILDERFGAGNYKAVYVTTKFHVFRAGKAAQMVGLKCEGIGSYAKWYIMPNNLLREYAALVHYALFGKI